ncbi:MAG TPA: PepSY-associated TM helix domain-containing protein, partial [Pseudomonadales bacterium]
NQQQSLYWNEQNISYCSQLNTALRYQSFILALCNEQIIVLTSSGLLVEKLIEFPEPFKKMALDENTASIILAGESQSYSFDLENLNFLPLPLLPQNIISPLPTTLPSSILARLDGKLIDHSITWERVLLDLHSGRFFGQAGILFVDLLALMFCMLSITGAWLWLRRH